MRAGMATKGPRVLRWSERKALRTMMKKQKREGGAERPLDWMLEKEPISLIIVGRKTGSEAKVTLHPKYISEVM
jgi:hypothetical protein